MDQLLTISDLGKMLNIKKTAMYNALRSGILPPSIKIGSSRRWRKSTVEIWLESLEVDTEIQKNRKKTNAGKQVRRRFL